MIVLGLDPGETSGWCSFDTERRAVVDRGTFTRHDVPEQVLQLARTVDRVVLERPVAHGPTRPAVVECAYVAGRIVGMLGQSAVELTRLVVKQVLTAATLGEVQVRNDSTAWAALLLIHGGEQAGRKGGPLHGVRSHERALAVAVAWGLREGAASTAGVLG